MLCQIHHPWWNCVALALFIAVLYTGQALAQATLKGSATDAKEPAATTASTADKAPAVERADSATMFTAAAKMLGEKRLEDAGFLFYVAQLRARIDMDSYKPVEPADSGNGPGLAIAAMGMQLGETISPALMRSRCTFGRVVDRIEKWFPAYSSTYSPGWKFKREVSEADFNEVAQETKSRWLRQMRESRQLLQDDEYFRLFCLVQEYHYQDTQQTPWDKFGDSRESRRGVSKKENQAAESRLKQIEQEHKVEFGMFGGGSRPTPPRKPDYAVKDSEVTYEGRPIPGADAATFEILADIEYAKDSKQVYVRGYPIAGADLESFRVIGGAYARDKARIYCGNVPMQIADKDRFEVISPSSSWEICFSKDFLLYGDKSDLASIVITEETPAVVGEGWARDGKNYYYGVSKVMGADYQSFRVVDKSYAEDKNQEYEGATPMKKGSIPSWVERNLD